LKYILLVIGGGGLFCAPDAQFRSWCTN